MPSDTNRANLANYQRTLFLVRGAPGSGKSRLARIIAPGACYSADDYFDRLAMEQASTYAEVWDPKLLASAHAQCIERVKGAMAARCERISVHNTMTTRQELQTYRDLARTNGYATNIIRMENDFGNVHGVPHAKVLQMRDRMETA